MISTSSGFQNLLSQSSRHFLARIRHDGSVLDCDIKSIKIYKGACGDSTLVIGSVYSSYAELTINGLTTLLENEDIEIQIGMTVSGTPEYITIGKFTVNKIKSSEYESNVTAVGFISSKLAVDLPELQSQTITDIISAISTATGLTVSLSGLTAAGTITEPMPAMTCRSALELVTFLLGGYATETADGNIKICKYQIPSSKLAVDGDRMLEPPKFADIAFAMTGVKVIVSEESYDDEGELIPAVSYETATTVRQIYENKYMTQALFSTFANNIVGYTYMPGEVDLSLGDPRLEPWDCLSLAGRGSDTYYVPCLQVVHSFDGGLSTEVTAVGAATSDVEVQGSITKQLGQVNSELVKAQDGAAKAVQAAGQAQGILEDMQEAAVAAGTTLEGIYADAESAKSTLAGMEAAATAANTTLTAIYQDAADAKSAAQAAEGSASEANTYAGSALTQLGVVEDVIDVLNWISEHGTYKATTDTEVVAGKYYFTRSGSSPNYTYTVVTNPTGNPRTKGYYELDSVDEAMSNYVSSHLALTNQGLWVVNDNNSYKILLASDGMKVYDASGVLVSTFGESITFSSTRPQTIGNNNSYVKFYKDGNTWKIAIAADAITFSGTTVAKTSDVSAAISNLEIGGRNLLLHTKDYYDYTLGASSGETVPSISDGEPTKILTYPVIVSTTAKAQSAAPSERIPYSAIRDKTLTFSAYFKAESGAIFGYLPVVDLYDSPTGGTRVASSDFGFAGTGTGNWEKVSHTVYITDDWFVDKGITSDYSNTYVRFAVQRSFNPTNYPFKGVVQAKELKWEIGNKASDWTPAPEDIYYAIGGRNIIRNTRDFANWTLSNASSGSSYQTVTLTESEPTYIANFPDTSSGVVYEYMFSKPRFPYSYIRDKHIIFSADVKAANGVTTGLVIQYSTYAVQDGGTRLLYTNRITTITGTGDWQTITQERDIYDAIFTGGSGTVDFDSCFIRFEVWKAFDQGYTAGFQIKNIKVEVGNSATEWSEAPEDASTKATAYITAIDNNGIRVHAFNNPTTNYAQIDANGLDVYKGGTSVAFYGETARVGLASGKRFEIKSDGAYIYNGTTQLGYYGSFTRIGDYYDKNVRIDGGTNGSIKINSTGDTQVASFSEDTIELGKNSTSSKIKMCGGKGLITYDTQTAQVRITDAEEKQIFGIGNTQVLLISEDEYGNDAWVTVNGGEDYGGYSTVNIDCDYFQVQGRSGITSTFWLMEQTPPAGSQTYNAIWHQSSNGNYGIYRPSSSSRRYKEDIVPVESDRLDPHRLYDIQVMQFKFKEGYFPQDDPYEQNRVDVIGFIAEDVLEHYPQAAIIINDEVDNWDERYIIPPMLKLIQEQNDRITELERRLS